MMALTCDGVYACALKGRGVCVGLYLCVFVGKRTKRHEGLTNAPDEEQPHGPRLKTHTHTYEHMRNPRSSFFFHTETSGDGGRDGGIVLFRLLFSSLTNTHQKKCGFLPRVNTEAACGECPANMHGGCVREKLRKPVGTWAIPPKDFALLPATSPHARETKRNRAVT